VTKLLYSRLDAAEALSLSVSTIDMLVGRGMLRARRQGRRVLIPHAEIERFSKREFVSLWPAKQNGKTVRGYRHGEARHLGMDAIDLRIEGENR